MSDSKYTVNEPHPHVSRNAYMGSGRGGAGNIFKAPVTTPATGIATPAIISPPSSGRFYSGRGGAGNAHAASQRNTMSFEEQYQLQSHIESKPLGHVGRGGAGNVYASNQSQSHGHARRDSDVSSSSSGSVRAGIMERIHRSISRN